MLASILNRSAVASGSTKGEIYSYPVIPLLRKKIIVLFIFMPIDT